MQISYISRQILIIIPPNLLHRASTTMSSSEDFQSLAHVSNTLLQFISSMSLKCAVELGIPEAIQAHGRPMPLPLLAAAISLPAAKLPCLARLMRMLEHTGFFAKPTGEESYALTPSSSCLLRGASGLVRGILQPPLVTPWLHLSSWFRTDAPNPFLLANGTSIFEYAGTDPGFNRLFNAAMATDSAFVTREVVEKHGRVFDGLTSVVDVGGGNGTVARALAAGFAHLRCTVLDLAHVVAAQEPGERVEFVRGDMFDHIPPADAVFLKCVLHDLEDEDCLKVLRRSKEAISSSEKKGGKVIVIDMVLDVINENNYRSRETNLFMDMQMMAVTGGKERDEKEWKKIFHQAGFAGHKITPLSSLCLIELFP